MNANERKYFRRVPTSRELTACGGAFTPRCSKFLVASGLRSLAFTCGLKQFLDRLKTLTERWLSQLPDQEFLAAFDLRSFAFICGSRTHLRNTP